MNHLIRIVVVIVAGMLLAVTVFHCKHEETCVSVVKEASCAEVGQEDVICRMCGDVLERRVLEALGHSFGTYKLVVAPGVNRNGVEVRICSVCSEKEKRDYVCNHVNTYMFIAAEPGCVQEGREDAVCQMCGTVVGNCVLGATGHAFGDWTIVTYPTKGRHGSEERTCSVCGFDEMREYVCAHEEISEIVVREATCVQAGQADMVCEMCGVVTGTRTLHKRSCSYGDWIYAEYATPVKEGSRYKKCSSCGNRVSETYSKSMSGKNSVYIPGTGIDHVFHVGSFTQSAVDRYDIVYSKDNGEHNPFILGHKTGTMRNLHKVTVGQYIYVSVNGVIETYQVIVSEYGIQNDKRKDIIGQDTGASIWDSCGGKTLHMYTCYGSNPNGRWMVLARLV